MQKENKRVPWDEKFGDLQTKTILNNNGIPPVVNLIKKIFKYSKDEGYFKMK